MRSAGEVAGFVEVDAGGRGDGESVRAERAPRLGGDAGLLAQLAPRAFLGRLAGFPPAAGKEEVVAPVGWEVGAEESYEAVVVPCYDDGRVADGLGIAHTGRG